MTDLQALHAKLDQIADALRDLAARMSGRPMTPAQCGAVVALSEVFGTAGFTTSEAVVASQLQLGARPALRAALEALVGGSIDPQRVGIALSRVVELGGDAGPVRLSAPRFERGRRLWCCERQSARR